MNLIPCVAALFVPVALVPLLAKADAAGQKYFSDTVVIDQNNQRQRFYSDLVQGKTVVIHSFFASCHGACPVVLGHMKSIQEHLGSRLGKEVVLLSITVNSDEDTPAKMKQLADSLNARAGWYFLSGQKTNTDCILHKLGQYVEAKESHSPVILIGNESTGVWTKVLTSATTQEVFDVIDKISFTKGR